MDATVHNRQPATSGGRGPIRAASRPLAPDSSKVTTVTGTSDEPATTGLSPAMISRAGMNTNAKPPRAPLTTKVTALAARNRAGQPMLGAAAHSTDARVNQPS